MGVRGYNFPPSIDLSSPTRDASISEIADIIRSAGEAVRGSILAVRVPRQSIAPIIPAAVPVAGQTFVSPQAESGISTNTVLIIAALVAVFLLVR